MPYRIAITGHFRVGKDTFADLLAAALPNPTVKLHFADALKYEVALMLYAHTHPADRDGTVTGWIPAELYADRVDKFAARMVADRQLNGLAWQWYGEWCRQKVDLDYWIKHPAFQDKYRNAKHTYSNIIVSDMRHVNEAEWCQSQGFHLVRIVGPCRFERERRDPNHASESSVDSLPVNTVISNTGDLELLRTEARVLAVFLAR